MIDVQRLQELLKGFYNESQCVGCYVEDMNEHGYDAGNGIDSEHSSKDCPMAKLQRQYVEMFGEDDD